MILLHEKLFSSILLICVAGAHPASVFSADYEVAQNQIEVEAKEDTSNTNAKPESSKWGKFLPLPIFVTEPAIGEGLGATLIYFHHEDEVDKPGVSTAQGISKTGEHSKPPPVATGIFGFYTNTDTAAVGVGHSNTFADDRFRLRAAAVEARINSFSYIGDRPVGFQLQGNMLFAGVGSVKVGDEQTETRDDIRTIGFGTRFLALRKEDAWVGLDIARGPEDVAWYIQIGSPW